MSDHIVPQYRGIVIASLMLRVTLAAAFLSAVADRFDGWGGPGTPNVSWGGFGEFLDGTALLLWFLPTATALWFGWAATGLEMVLANKCTK